MQVPQDCFFVGKLCAILVGQVPGLPKRGVTLRFPGAGGETEFASSRAALAASPDDLEPAELSRLICSLAVSA